MCMNNTINLCDPYLSIIVSDLEQILLLTPTTLYFKLIFCFNYCRYELS
jgi:hypothetical protein